MGTAAIQLVRPAGLRDEALAIVAAITLVLVALSLWIRAHGHEGGREPLQQWQVSAFEALQGPDQAIYNALDVSKYDILYLYDDLNMFNEPGQAFRWPSIRDLQEALVPPFVEDRSWEQNGALRWVLHEPLGKGEMQGSVMYLGTGGTVAGQGSFLLVIGHVHAGFTNNNSLGIWWNARSDVGMPQSGFRDGLILQGWKEVVPHSGAAELKRLFGRDPSSAPPDAEEIIDGLFAD